MTRSLRVRFTMAVLALVAAAAPARMTAQRLTEAQLKSGFVYNAGIFVEWPGHTTPIDTPLVVGFVRESEIGPSLATLTGRRVNGRTIAVKPFAEDDDPREYQILFLGKADPRFMAALRHRIGDAPVLTIGESEAFTGDGGVIRLYMENGRLRFEINVTRAERARLHISARMLSLAKIVR